MSTERRWYEPPTPRDWRRPNATELQRLQSSTSLRKAILERTSSTPASKILDRTSLKSSSSSGRSIVPGVDASVLERNLQEISRNEPLDDPLNRTVRPLAGRDSRPPSLRRNKSLANLNATYVFKNWRGTDVFESVETTPPRPRSSSMTKYTPLPSIASTKNPEHQPPPLIRSRTFDVIDTNMKNLPTVDDSRVNHGHGLGKELEPPCLVTVNIEGKTLVEYLSHARDGLLRSRPATRYGRSELYESPGFSTQSEGLVENYPGGVAWASERASFNQAQFPVATNHSISKASLLLPSHNAVKFDSYTPPGMQREDNKCEHRKFPCEECQGLAGEMPVSTERKDNMTDDDDSYDSHDDKENDSDDDDDDDMDDDDDDDMDDDDDDDDGKEKETEGKNAKHNSQAEESHGSNEDIHIYFMLPDDSLLLVCTSPSWTLATLLSVVGGMRVGGRRMAVALDGVQQRDLNSDLQDLGITHNTTVYLLEAG